MASFTAQDVKKLRDLTGVGMMESKKALTEADGDMDIAMTILREKGANVDKSHRTAADGLVYTKTTGNVGVILEVNTETDFVAKNEDFQKFVDDVANVIIKENPVDNAALMGIKLIGGETVEEGIKDKIHIIGENIVFRRFSRSEGNVYTYTHGAGTVGAMVTFDTDLSEKDEFVQYAKDITLQIAATTPKYLSREDVPELEVKEEKDFLTKQVIDEGKPEHIAEKIVEGRMNKLYYGEIVLLEQEYVKDDKINIKQFTENTAKELGGKIEIKSFVYFIKGEGLEKKEEDFASEIANMIK